jgi:hypothetical protein
MDCSSTEEGKCSGDEPPSDVSYLPLPSPAAQASRNFPDIKARLEGLRYLRKIYVSCVASKKTAPTNIFFDSIPYIKFHEIVTGGRERWPAELEWIKKVFWGLMTLDAVQVEDLKNGEKLVKLSEIFQRKANPGVLDLRAWEERVKNKLRATTT